MLKGNRFLQNRYAFLNMKQESRDKGRKIAIWVLVSLVFTVSLFLFNSNVSNAQPVANSWRLPLDGE